MPCCVSTPFPALQLHTSRYSNFTVDISSGLTASYDAITADLTAGVSPHLAAPLLILNVTVTNVGKVESDYSVLLFMSPENPVPGAPITSLVGFDRVHLKPGQSITVPIDIDAYSLAHADVTGRFVTMRGNWVARVDETTAVVTVV